MDIPRRMQASGPARVLARLYQIIALGVNRACVVEVWPFHSRRLQK